MTVLVFGKGSVRRDYGRLVYFEVEHAIHKIKKNNHDRPKV